MRRQDFYFDLPKELIAQTPIDRRDASRLLLMDKHSGELQDRHFYELPDFLNEGDCLVLNDTRVIPARLMGQKKETGAVIEVLLLKDTGDNVWEALVRPGKKAREGAEIIFGDGLLRGVVERVAEDGNRFIRFYYDGIFNQILDKLGTMPLPPYITEKLEQSERYQTVYSKQPGSAAAPTAGLHFTKELLKKIEDKGVSIAYLTLHVGLGTFRPVKEDQITDHKMHSEWYSLSKQSADIINAARKRGGRIIAVGTTACRTLETVGGMADEDRMIPAASGNTDIFIYPGYKFKVIDALITNFHLPESTLIMLVSALAGRENVLAAYKHAVDLKYRFFSFGDAMFIY